MNWVKVEKFVSRGQAFVPVNAKDVGDVVQLIYDDGHTELLCVQSKTFLKQVLRFFGTELLALRRRYGQVIGKKQLIPIPLSKQWTLVPFNMRKPVGRQDRTGWIVAEYVRHIRENAPSKSEMLLHHRTLVVYHSTSFCLQQMRSARLVQDEFAAIHRSPDECRETRWLYYIGE